MTNPGTEHNNVPVLPGPIEDALRGLIHRVRRIIIIRGICATCAAGLGAFLVIMGIDAGVTLFAAWPRWLLTVAAYSVWIGSLVWFLVRPLARTFTLAGIARLIETNRPELQERLSSAVELLGSRDAPEIRGSEAMIRALTEEAVRDAAVLQPRREISFRAAVPFAVAAAIVVVLLSGLWLARPRQTQFLLSRAAAPFLNLPNVHAADLVVEPGDAAIVSGTRLRISVRTANPAVGSAVLHQVDAGGRETVVEMAAVPTATNAAGRTFAVTLPGVLGGFRYRIHAGDALTRYFSIRVSVAPAIRHIDLQYRYPGYSRLGTRHERDAQGTIRALVGTEVTVSALVNKPVQSAMMRMSGASSTNTVPGVRREAGKEMFYDFTFTLPRDLDGSWTLILTDEMGLANPAFEYAIQAVPDYPPTIGITSMRQQEIRLNRDDSLPMAVIAEDDIGLSGLAMVLVVADSSNEVVRPQPMPAQAGQGVKAMKADALLALDDPLFATAAFVSLRMRATDNLPAEQKGPQSADSDSFMIIFDEMAPSWREQVLASQEELVLQGLIHVQEKLSMALEQSLSLDEPLARQKTVAPETAKAVDAMQDSLGNADQVLRDIAAGLDKGFYAAFATNLTALADEHVGKAENLAGQIRLADTAGERVAVNSNVTAEIKTSLAALEQARTAHELARDALHRAMDLDRLAGKQGELARSRQESELEDPGQYASPEWQQEQNQVADELAEVARDTPDAAERAAEETAALAMQTAEEAAGLAERQDELAAQTQAETDSLQNRDREWRELANRQEELAKLARMDPVSVAHSQPMSDAAAEIKGGEYDKAVRDQESIAGAIRREADGLMKKSDRKPDGWDAGKAGERARQLADEAAMAARLAAAGAEPGSAKERAVEAAERALEAALDAGESALRAESTAARAGRDAEDAAREAGMAAMDGMDSAKAQEAAKKAADALGRARAAEQAAADSRKEAGKAAQEAGLAVQAAGKAQAAESPGGARENAERAEAAADAAQQAAVRAEERARLADEAARGPGSPREQAVQAAERASREAADARQAAATAQEAAQTTERAAEQARQAAADAAQAGQGEPARAAEQASREAQELAGRVKNMADTAQNLAAEAGQAAAEAAQSAQAAQQSSESDAKRNAQKAEQSARLAGAKAMQAQHLAERARAAAEPKSNPAAIAESAQKAAQQAQEASGMAEQAAKSARQDAQGAAESAARADGEQAAQQAREAAQFSDQAAQQAEQAAAAAKQAAQQAGQAAQQAAQQAQKGDSQAARKAGMEAAAAARTAMEKAQEAVDSADRANAYAARTRDRTDAAKLDSLAARQEELNRQAAELLGKKTQPGKTPGADQAGQNKETAADSRSGQQDGKPGDGKDGRKDPAETAAAALEKARDSMQQAGQAASQAQQAADRAGKQAAAESAMASKAEAAGKPDISRELAEQAGKSRQSAEDAMKASQAAAKAAEQAKQMAEEVLKAATQAGNEDQSESDRKAAAEQAAKAAEEAAKFAESARAAALQAEKSAKRRGPLTDQDRALEAEARAIGAAMNARRSVWRAERASAFVRRNADNAEERIKQAEAQGMQQDQIEKARDRAAEVRTRADIASSATRESDKEARISRKEAYGAEDATDKALAELSPKVIIEYAEKAEAFADAAEQAAARAEEWARRAEEVTMSAEERAAQAARMAEHQAQQAQHSAEAIRSMAQAMEQSLNEARQLAEQARQTGQSDLARRAEEKFAEARQQAEAIRRMSEAAQHMAKAAQSSASQASQAAQHAAQAAQSANSALRTARSAQHDGAQPSQAAQQAADAAQAEVNRRAQDAEQAAMRTAEMAQMAGRLAQQAKAVMDPGAYNQLMRQQKDLAAEAAQLAADMSQTRASEQSKSSANHASQSAREASEALSQGSMPQARTAASQAGEKLGSLSDALRTEAANSPESMPLEEQAALSDLGQRAAEMAARQSGLTRQMEAMAANRTLDALQQQQDMLSENIGRVSRFAGSVNSQADRLHSSAEASSEASKADREMARANELAAMAAKLMQEMSQQGSASGSTRPSSQGMQEAADEISQVQQSAAQSLNQASRHLQNVARAMGMSPDRKAQSGRTPESQSSGQQIARALGDVSSAARSRAARDALKAAAQMARAADQASAEARSRGANMRPSIMQSLSRDARGQQQNAMSSDDAPYYSRRLGTKLQDWLRFHGEQKGDALQTPGSEGPEEYRPIIKRYFREVSGHGGEEQ